MLFAAVVSALLVARAPPPRATPADWMPLIDQDRYDEARRLCTGWLEDADARTKAEGHKCLANVELFSGGEHPLRVEGDASGGTIGPGYDAERALRAVAHLDVAVGLAPQDLSIHQGRLHVLKQAGMYDRMKAALEASIRAYEGRDPLDAWIAYPAELFEDRQYETAETLLLVLEKRFPGDHRIAGNLSAVCAMLKRDGEALSWATKAVKAAPDDFVDNWNLARVYDLTGKLDLADAAYRKALSLASGERRAEASCRFADFLEKRRKEPERACALQRKARCRPTACTR